MSRGIRGDAAVSYIRYILSKHGDAIVLKDKPYGHLNIMMIFKIRD